MDGETASDEWPRMGLWWHYWTAEWIHPPDILSGEEINFNLIMQMNNGHHFLNLNSATFRDFCSHVSFTVCLKQNSSQATASVSNLHNVEVPELFFHYRLGLVPFQSHNLSPYSFLPSLHPRPDPQSFTHTLPHTDHQGIFPFLCKTGQTMCMVLMGMQS